MSSDRDVEVSKYQPVFASSMAPTEIGNAIMEMLETSSRRRPDRNPQERHSKKPVVQEISVALSRALE
jgi:hypothetical protein